MERRLRPGAPTRLGAHFDGEGVNFAVFSANAERIELCLFSEDGDTELDRLALPERTGAIWHGRLDGLRPGARYGFRAHGAYAPDQGHRFNPNKLLMDPYTRELAGAWTDHPATLGYDRAAAGQDLSFDSRDSARHVAKSVISDPAHFAEIAGHPNRPWDETLIYEAHAKGLTQLHPGVEGAVRGAYDGLASDAVLDHLLGLGVTAVELMPVHAFIDDAFLLERGLRNYWGYNSVGFFAVEPRYFGPLGLAGFRDMVRRFHAAGIEVILDVVYNHTAEGDQRGPTLCFRGLDNASYYRLINGRPRYYVNDTGCGNTVNVANPHVLRLVMDSLRFWVTHMGIDGFRFDLATTLAREDHGFDPMGGFFDAIRQDPALAGVKLIAEPWDIGPGGYRLGEFIPEFTEWNDGYRDTVRRFWRGDAHSAQDLGARLLGSAGEFDRDGRRAWSSVNFLAAHDGFTLADVTAYAERDNLENGEGNHDGHHANFSDNCGAEGQTDDRAVLSRRARRQRNMLATLFLSQGAPMLLAGDEIGNSQGGNNNAYCQDNPIGWVDWAGADTALQAFVARLSAFRAAHVSVRQSRFLHGGLRASDGFPDVEWRDLDGAQLNWRDPALSSLCLTLRCSAEAAESKVDDDVTFLVFNREDEAATVALPPAPAGRVWMREIDSADDGAAPAIVAAGEVSVQGASVVAFALSPQPAGAP